MIGKTISHYHLMEKLGEGGMGEVYLAEDASLNRKVALKFLPERLQENSLAHKRFLREAEAAAALEHPYICNIKEVSSTDEGQDFIVMEYVPGQTLKQRLEAGPLPVEGAVQIALEVAEALQMAHSRGIVHRDLKPANIMLTPQGHAKVMDFGLAKRVAGGEGAEQDLTTVLTREGSTPGTPAYMSPEQVKAEPVDHRADLFSFGILLYEMVTGVHPFRRRGPVETMGAILHEEPAPLAGEIAGARDGLEETVRCLLAKDPQQRIQTIDEVAERLRGMPAPGGEAAVVKFLRRHGGRPLVWALASVLLLAVVVSGWFALWEGPAAPGGPAVSSIAVLPLANLSGEPEQEYFVDGMTEALITDLSKIGALKVISRSSAMRYKGTDQPLAEIARELGVEAVVEGSVLREGDQVRITAQLIEAATERNLWADRYERSLTSILVLQGEVAQAIAREIRVALTPGEEDLLTRRRQVNPEAYEAYLRGLSHSYKVTPNDLETAQRYFETAIEKDSDYALAYAGIAGVWIARRQMGITNPLEAGPRVRQSLRRALELDDTIAEVHYALATEETWGEWNWEAAEKAFRRAIALDPNYADVRAFYSHYLMLMTRQDEAMAQMKLALELDPLNELFQWLYSVVLLWGARKYDETISWSQGILKKMPNFPHAHARLVEAYYAKGMYREAFEAAKANWTARGRPAAVAALESGYSKGGFPGAMNELAEWKLTNHWDRLSIAFNYAAAGKKQQALDWLERALEARDPNVPYIGVAVQFDSLRSEPRFQQMLRRLNFPEDVLSVYLKSAP